jgi:hypothetical protein
MFVDVLKKPMYFDYLTQIEQDAQNYPHRNSNNYINLIDNIKKNFLSYEIIIDDFDNVIAGSGLKLYDNCGRCASLTYITFKNRRKFGSNLLLSEDIFVPYEIEVAKAHNLDCVFFTIELLRRRNAVKKFIKNLKNKGINFELFPHMVNTCRKIHNNHINYEQPCWQNAAVQILKKDLNLDTMSIKDYKTKYYKQEKNRLC